MEVSAEHCQLSCCQYAPGIDEIVVQSVKYGAVLLELRLGFTVLQRFMQVGILQATLITSFTTRHPRNCSVAILSASFYGITEFILQQANSYPAVIKTTLFVASTTHLDGDGVQVGRSDLAQAAGCLLGSRRVLLTRCQSDQLMYQLYQDTVFLVA